MFNGDCLSLSNENGNAFLSRYVMQCHAPDKQLQSARLNRDTTASPKRILYPPRVQSQSIES